MSSILKKVIKVAAPIALSAIAPGFGTALGAGLGLSGTAAGIAGNALIGGATGLLDGGGLKGALLGAASGGLGSALNSGSLGNALGGTSGSAASYGVGGKLGSTLSGLQSAATKTAGSGLASALKGAVGNLGSVNSLSTIGSGIQSYMAQQDAEEQLRKAQGRAQQALAPYSTAGIQGIQSLQKGFDPSQITNDPGYQFRLQQGNQALQRSQAAQGMIDSGAALKAAQEYGQGLASQAYNDAYAQWLAKNSGLANYGQNATGNLIDSYSNLGNIGANASIAKSNVLTGTLSSLLRGTKTIVGYDNQGNPIYAD